MSQPTQDMSPFLATMKSLRWFLSIFAIAVAFLSNGCGKSDPVLAGGKPATFWIKALQDPDAKMRRKAVVKLGNIGADDETVVPALVEALKDNDAGVRKEAIISLVKLGAAAKDAVPALNDLKDRDQDTEIRSFARKALAKIQ